MTTLVANQNTVTVDQVFNKINNQNQHYQQFEYKTQQPPQDSKQLPTVSSQSHSVDDLFTTLANAVNPSTHTFKFKSNYVQKAIHLGLDYCIENNVVMSYKEFTTILEQYALEIAQVKKNLCRVYVKENLQKICASRNITLD